MHQLLQLAAQHAGVDDIFHSLVPRWALGTLFDRILNSKNADHELLTTTWFQQWIIAEGLNIPSKAVLEFFMRSPSVETISKHEFVQLLRANNLLYHSMRRRVECTAHCQQTPEEVLMQREEMRQRNKQAAAAAKCRIRHTPDRTALYLRKRRTFISSSMASEFGGTTRLFTSYLPPMFKTTMFMDTGASSAQTDMQLTTGLPSAGAGIATDTCSAGSTLTHTWFSTKHKQLPYTTKVLATLRHYKTSKDLYQGQLQDQKEKRDSPSTASALNSPVVSTVKKPAAYRLTNGMIGGRRKLCWSAEDDEDSVVLPALPLTVTEESDPVTKHITQVNATVRRRQQAATLSTLTNFHAERQLEGRVHPSMLDLPPEVWSAMVANSKRIIWPGQGGRCNKDGALSRGGDEEAGKDGAATKAATKAALLNASIRLQRTKRLRQLFEQMDKNRTGVLTLDQFKEYMARENPRSMKRASDIFAAMGNRHQENSQDDVSKVPTVSFLELLRVFFPETTEVERRHLAVVAPPSVSPCTGLYDSLELEMLLEQVHAKNLPPRTDGYTKKMWESVRQLLGALGLGDHIDEESRSQLFDMLDVDRNGKIDQKDILLWYMDMMDEHERAGPCEGVV